MRRLSLVLPGAAVAVASLLLAAGPAGAASGFGSAACLRGNWVANQAETQRVLDALVPTGQFESYGKLYMLFRDGAFQYGSTRLVLRTTIGEAEMIARARFFTLAPYSARPGVLTFRGGASTIEYEQMTASKGGRTYSVPGPPPRTVRTPGGSVPFQCRGSTLKVKLPRFASLGWITLHRG
jgi:hypothetical protein